MKLGISWGCYGGLSTDEQIALMSKNGFESTFFMANNPRSEEIVSATRAAGIVCENLHAPFKGINKIWAESKDGDLMADTLKSSLDTCARYEIPVLVVHLSAGVAPRINDIGYERFAGIMEHARKAGVAVAYENQRYLANIAFAFEQFEDAVFCWDVGHEACFTNGRQYMPLFGNKLAALHIHDNHRIYNDDAHMLPFDGSIDFDRVASQIAATDYHGSVMLEVIRSHSELYADVSADEYYARAAKAAAKLERMISGYRA